MTAGLKSTELWLTVVTNIAIVAAALADALPPRWAAVSAATATAAYAVARGIAKNGSTPAATPKAP